jgi:hypothetical protein
MIEFLRKIKNDNTKNKHLRYLAYMLLHKWFVFLECKKQGIIWRGIVHDLSKFRPSEWIPYCNYFYGNLPSRKDFTITEWWEYNGLTKEEVKPMYDKAWLYHQHRNPHHWQYWLLMKDNPDQQKPIPLPMPDVFMKEMLADWRGAGKAIHDYDDTKDFYLKNREWMILHENVKDYIEMELELWRK